MSEANLAPVGAEGRNYAEMQYHRLIQDPFHWVDPVVGMKAHMWATPRPLARGPGQPVAPPEDQVALTRAFASAAFGSRRGDDFHKGIDLPVPIGTPVIAPMMAGVELARKDDIGRPGGKGVQLLHAITDPSGRPWRFVHGLWHMDSVDVSEGQQVALGASLGTSGNSGGVRPHLHWQTRIEFPVDKWVMPMGPLKGHTLNPWPFLNSYWVRLIRTSPGDASHQDAWASWIWTGDHAGAAAYLQAHDAPDGTVLDEVWRSTRQAAEEAALALQQPITDLKDEINNIPWGWIGAGAVALLLTYGAVTSYAKAKGGG